MSPSRTTRISRLAGLSTTGRKTTMFIAVSALACAPHVMPVAALAQETPPSTPPAEPAAPPAPANDVPPAPPTPAPAADAPKVDVDQIRTAARAAMQKGQWADAVNAWSTVLQFVPGDEEALRGRTRAQQMLEGGTVLNDVATDRDLLRQQVAAQFKADMQRAQTFLQRQDFDQAKLAAVSARTRLDLARNVLPQADFVRMSDEAEKLVETITDQSREFQLQQDQRARAEQSASSAAASRTEAENRAKKVTEILVNVRKLQMQQKYREALQVLEGALELDPTNPAALTLRDALMTTITYQKYTETMRRGSIGQAEMQQEAQRAMVPPSVNLTGLASAAPARWSPTQKTGWVSDRRVREPEYGASGYRESPQNMATLARLHNTSLPVPLGNGQTLERPSRTSRTRPRLTSTLTGPRSRCWSGRAADHGEPGSGQRACGDGVAPRAGDSAQQERRRSTKRTAGL